jgi:hypothetical protein
MPYAQEEPLQRLKKRVFERIPFRDQTELRRFRQSHNLSPPDRSQKIWTACPLRRCHRGAIAPAQLLPEATVIVFESNVETDKVGLAGLTWNRQVGSKPLPLQKTRSTSFARRSPNIAMRAWLKAG